MAKGKKLGTLKQEEKACRAAFKSKKIGVWVRCCHHSRHVEKLTERAGERIDYIIANKFHETKINADERPRRLREFRPLSKRAAKVWAKGASLDAEFDKVDRQDNPGTTWDGNSIFGRGWKT
jgi:hypothetical protein